MRVKSGIVLLVLTVCAPKGDVGKPTRLYWLLAGGLVVSVTSLVCVDRGRGWGILWNYRFSLRSVSSNFARMQWCILHWV